ncbi:MAG: prolipoprotein diacylglyceryl transferase [Deltaproteobacteria bacterium RBG_13_49_15]|nr:MAG: prolipoprotein diacylglyceryl transferase [Deltaproteobacteria bacterium RBG_13_49_15]
MKEWTILWQHLPQSINPVIFTVGSFRIHYYGLMYLIAFAATYALVSYRIRHEHSFSVSKEQIKDLMVYMIVGLLIGARLGYVVFYNPGYYAKHPFEIILPFQFENGITFTGFSGMSFHGGLIGVILSSWWYSKKAGLDVFEMADLFCPVVPLGYTFGRVGNFINGELFGRITTHPIGMYFPFAPGADRRHPSQLYEAFFEGLFLFIVLWNVRRRNQPAGAMLAFYLAGYGIVRFIIEYFREPDAHIGLLWISFSMGQILCTVMTAFGLGLYFYLRFVNRRKV